MNPQQQPQPFQQSFGQSPVPPDDPYSRAIPGPLMPDMMPQPQPQPQPQPTTTGPAAAGSSPTALTATGSLPATSPVAATEPAPTPQPQPQPTPIATTGNTSAMIPTAATSDASRGPAGPEPQASGPDGRYDAAGPVAANGPVATTQPQPPTNVTPDLPTSTQSTLLISELRDGLVIMKDGSFRAVIACQSINFDLMSETEREGVEYSYQSFINSLNFTTQILIRSQRVDIGPYLQRLTDIRKNNENMLLGVLMDDYINFIDILSQEANIMDKSFFIVIPYYPDANAEKALQQVKGLFGGGKNKVPEVTKIDRATYDKAITEINNRVETVTSGLFQMGIHSVRLNTKELAALYYNFNNPDTAVREPLVDFNKLATTYVKKAEDEGGVQNV